jgi:putative tryptophan/tyrosine transport system substrate-binding protein
MLGNFLARGNDMKFGQLERREFIALTGGAAAAWPLVARGQQRARVYRVGWLFSSGEMSVQFSQRGYRLPPRGRREGREARPLTRAAAHRRLCSDHPRSPLPASFAGFRAAKTASMKSAPEGAATNRDSAIPIIFAMAADPVAEGFVEITLGLDARILARRCPNRDANQSSQSNQ